jgi:hypothetical protein
LSCSGFSHLIGCLGTTFIRRRWEFRRLERRRWRRFLGRVQFVRQFRRQPQFRRFGFARIERAQFEFRLLPLRRD